MPSSQCRPLSSRNEVGPGVAEPRPVGPTVPQRSTRPPSPFAHARPKSGKTTVRRGDPGRRHGRAQAQPAGERGFGGFGGHITSHQHKTDVGRPSRNAVRDEPQRHDWPVATPPPPQAARRQARLAHRTRSDGVAVVSHDLTMAVPPGRHTFAERPVSRGASTRHYTRSTPQCHVWCVAWFGGSRSGLGGGGCAGGGVWRGTAWMR